MTTSGAKSGVCGNEYAKLYKTSVTKKFKNGLGHTLATITMQKRWCGSYRHGSGSTYKLEYRVDSWYSPPLKVTIPTAASLTGWKSGSTGYSDAYYYGYPNSNSPKGGHYNYKRRHLKHCPPALGICDDKYARLKIWARYNGTFKKSS